jgi:hypothetical protein
VQQGQLFAFNVVWRHRRGGRVHGQPVKAQFIMVTARERSSLRRGIARLPLTLTQQNPWLKPSAVQQSQPNNAHPPKKKQNPW